MTQIEPPGQQEDDTVNHCGNPEDLCCAEVGVSQKTWVLSWGRGGPGLSGRRLSVALFGRTTASDGRRAHGRRSATLRGNGVGATPGAAGLRAAGTLRIGSTGADYCSHTRKTTELVCSASRTVLVRSRDCSSGSTWKRDPDCRPGNRVGLRRFRVICACICHDLVCWHDDCCRPQGQEGCLAQAIRVDGTRAGLRPNRHAALINAQGPPACRPGITSPVGNCRGGYDGYTAKGKGFMLAVLSQPSGHTI